MWFMSMIPCPLLDEKTKKCTAYEGRPFQCRATYSTSPSMYCHPHEILQTGIVDRQTAMSKFHVEEVKAMRRHGLVLFLMPLSVAVLMGERVASGELRLEDAESALVLAYGENV